MKLRLLLPFLILGFPSFPAAAQPPQAEDEGDEIEIIEDEVVDRPDPAADKFWEAMSLLWSGRTEDLAAGRGALQEASDLEYTHAQSMLASCLLNGTYGFERDPRKGANLFQLAAERGNGFAMVSIGQCYFTGTGVRRNHDTAARWLTAALAPESDYLRPEPPESVRAAQPDGIAGQMAEDPVAMAKAAAHYLLGEIDAENKRSESAQAHFVAAARVGPGGREGIQEAALQAALNYAFGLGVPRDYAKATEMLEQSKRLTARRGTAMIHNSVAMKVVDEFAVADLEESLASESEAFQMQIQLHIASTLGNRKSRDYNLAEAIRWYELAADNGQAWAMLELAFIHAEGDLGAPDLAKAFAWFEKAGGGDEPKHSLAAANLAICYQNGLGTPADPVKAAALFQKYRDTHILAYAGSIGQAPTTVQRYEPAMKLQERMARKDPHAQYLMGLRNMGNWDIPADLPEAVKWFTRAARANHPKALLQLGIFHQTAAGRRDRQSAQNLAQAADYYRQAAELGEPDAMINYGYLLNEGSGVPRNTAEAERLYLKVLELDPNHATAHNNLATLYEQRVNEGLTLFKDEMLEHYEAGVELSSPHAAHNLGRHYFAGVHVPQDYQQAYTYLDQAAAWGYPQAHFQLGMMHEHGLGVPVTLTEAAYHYQLAAVNGHFDALGRLIQFYIAGRGVSKDLDRARFWLERMAQMGRPRALLPAVDILFAQGQNAAAVRLLRDLLKYQGNALVRDDLVDGFVYDRLSKCYENGVGVRQSASRARRYFNLAVEMKNPNALVRMALIQLKENKVPEAVQNLHVAAGTSPQAAYYLGQMYFFGQHMPKDEKRGLVFMRQAATRDHADAMYFLAGAANNKVDGAPPLDEAIRLLESAERLGHPQAAALREQIQAMLAPPPPAPEAATQTRSI